MIYTTDSPYRVKAAQRVTLLYDGNIEDYIAVFLDRMNKLGFKQLSDPLKFGEMVFELPQEKP